MRVLPYTIRPIHNRSKREIDLLLNTYSWKPSNMISMVISMCMFHFLLPYLGSTQPDAPSNTPFNGMVKEIFLQMESYAKREQLSGFMIGVLDPKDVSTGEPHTAGDYLAKQIESDLMNWCSGSSLIYQFTAHEQLEQIVEQRSQQETMYYQYSDARGSSKDADHPTILLQTLALNFKDSKRE